jgi:hypothetical protein
LELSTLIIDNFPSADTSNSSILTEEIDKLFTNLVYNSSVKLFSDNPTTVPACSVIQESNS